MTHEKALEKLRNLRQEIVDAVVLILKSREDPYEAIVFPMPYINSQQVMLRELRLVKDDALEYRVMVYELCFLGTEHNYVEVMDDMNVSEQIMVLGLLEKVK